MASQSKKTRGAAASIKQMCLQ